jgi:hypothetical protein
MKRQPNLILQSPITNILQEEILMKSLNTMFNNSPTLYVGKKQPHLKNKYKKFNQNSRERRQKISHLILQDHKQIGDEMLPL